MQYNLINTAEALQAYCDNIADAKLLAIDTEFVRTRTLLPRLGLVQVYDGQHLGLIDTVEINDLAPLVEILANKNVLKVLHSCSEDLEAFRANLGLIPSPIFDTQIAAGLLQIGPSIGYANLIEKLQDIVLDKGESRTDWIARPLSKEQLKYAAADVFYLLPAYHELAKQIEDKGMTYIVLSEVSCIGQKKTHTLPPKFAYLNIANAWKLSAKSRLALQLLAEWRLNRAREKDIAINFVLKEQVMVAIAMKLPNHLAQLSAIDGFLPRDIRQHGEHILSLVSQAQQADESECPPKLKRLIDFREYKKALADLKQVCQNISSDSHIPIEHLASKKQLNQWLKWCWFELDETEKMTLKPDIISGWRKQLFAPKLTQLFNNEKGKYHALRHI